MERRYHASDAIGMAYAAFLVALAALYRERVAEWRTLAAFAGAVLIGIPALLLAARRWPNRWTRFASAWDVVVVIPVLFFVTLKLVYRVHRQDFDSQLIAMDAWLGLDRVLEWATSIENGWAVDAMKVAWIAYYALPVIPGIELWIRDRRNYWEAKTMVLLAFVVAYLGYFATPALGGLGVAPASSGAVAFETLSRAISAAEGPDARDTYPSGHVMTSVVVIAICARHRLKISWLAVPLALAVMFSTIYLRYHYVIDCLAGLWIGAGVFFLGWWACRDRTGVEVIRERSWGRAGTTALAAALAGVLVVAGAGVAKRAYWGEPPTDPILIAALAALPVTLGILLACAWSAIDGAVRGYAVARLDPRGLTVGRRRLSWDKIASLAVVGEEVRATLKPGCFLPGDAGEVVLASRRGGAVYFDELVHLANVYRQTYGTVV